MRNNRLQTLRSLAVALCQRTAIDHGVRFDDVLSQSRRRPLVLIRHEVWWRCKNELGLGRTAMGRLFCRDKQTIFNGIRRHEQRMKEASNGQA